MSVSTIASQKKKEEDDDTKNKVQCYVCLHEIDRDHGGISCAQNHHVCPSCAPTLVDVVMGDPLNNIPIKCMQCHIDIHPPVFERQLTPEQMDIYLSYTAMSQIDDTECVVDCPHCKYFEIWSRGSDLGMVFFRCRRGVCNKVTCVFCRKDCQAPTSDECDDNDLDDSNEESMVYHFQCAELAPMKKLVEDAIANGAGVVCPNPECRLRGRKDDACTHMTCSNCHISYCYVCGQPESMCDKADSNGNIYSHNVDWHLHAGRCPMYLTEIGQIDDRWDSVDDGKCVDLLSRLRTLSLLRQAYNMIGEDGFRMLSDKYDSIKNCGYTEDEILHTDIRIINRDDVDT